MPTFDLYAHWSPANDELSARGYWAFPEHHSWDWLKDCHKLVDLGCGTGNMVSELIRRGHDVTGITYQPRELGHPHVMLGDMHCPPFEDHTFDGMIIWDSLEHCLSPFIALAEARRIVKPGGRGIIFMPGEMWIETEYHLYVLNIRQMKQLLKLTGWRVEKIMECDGQPQAAFYLVENPCVS